MQNKSRNESRGLCDYCNHRESAYVKIEDSGGDPSFKLVCKKLEDLDNKPFFISRLGTSSEINENTSGVVTYCKAFNSKLSELPGVTKKIISEAELTAKAREFYEEYRKRYH